MDLILNRNLHKNYGIFGEITDINGNHICDTLEHAYDDGDIGGFIAKIPPGTYICERGKHCLSNGVFFETFEVTGVANHTGLLFHKGNFNNDSEGCILLGDSTDGELLIDSGDAFKRFMILQNGCDEFKLQVNG